MKLSDLQKEELEGFVRYTFDQFIDVVMHSSHPGLAFSMLIEGMGQFSEDCSKCFNHEIPPFADTVTPDEFRKIAKEVNDGICRVMHIPIDEPNDLN